eukprot:CAMPEP_0185560088 /NCGR_PEP_ID=MMETSP1381-20130426/56037_1 /TAXON_ID=298111 /ORGANISM="Pavlova sp., Strain CCMP459" /LENGTH=79 /DNA_ID=CAMNT_0028173763 /DNA_START=114 /DNA_END=350 /DNA_ORIENTATION=-
MHADNHVLKAGEALITEILGVTLRGVVPRWVWAVGSPGATLIVEAPFKFVRHAQDLTRITLPCAHHGGSLAGLRVSVRI